MWRERFGKKPDMEAMLFMVGINVLGAPQVTKWSKEQKQDIMHIAVCTLLGQRGYFEWAYTDEDGWPHFNDLKPVSELTAGGQERLLQECLIEYFEL
ncbi:MAG: hypothetical protein EBZ77_04115 [Chitinophagia bacterium]|nr:hypothetical protein [Chitinophagia bacterium]